MLLAASLSPPQQRAYLPVIYSHQKDFLASVWRKSETAANPSVLINLKYPAYRSYTIGKEDQVSISEMAQHYLFQSQRTHQSEQQPIEVYGK